MSVIQKFTALMPAQPQPIYIENYTSEDNLMAWAELVADEHGWKRPQDLHDTGPEGDPLRLTSADLDDLERALGNELEGVTKLVRTAKTYLRLGANVLYSAC